MRCRRKPLSLLGFLAISCECHLLITASPMSLCQGDYQIETLLVHLSFFVIRSKANTKHRWTRWPTCFSISCSSKELQWFGAAVEQEVEWLSTNQPKPLQSTSCSQWHWCMSVKRWFFATDEHVAPWMVASAMPVFQCLNADLCWEALWSKEN